MKRRMNMNKVYLDVLPETDDYIFKVFLKSLDGKIVDACEMNPRTAVCGFSEKIYELSKELGKSNRRLKAWRNCALAFIGLSSILYLCNKAEQRHNEDTIKELQEELECRETMNLEDENPTDI
jgi:hypothetical protein